MGESMRSNLPVAVLVTGMLSLLASAGAALAGSNLDALVARLNGAADAGGRRQIMRSLSQAQRRLVHAEYQALSPEGKRTGAKSLADRGPDRPKSERARG